MDKKLCGRELIQSFIDTSVKRIDQICSSTSKRVIGDLVGNLCITQLNMKVYDVESSVKGERCNVKSVVLRTGPVVVACDHIKSLGVCRPVHYEQYTGQQAAVVNCK